MAWKDMSDKWPLLDIVRHLNTNIRDLFNGRVKQASGVKTAGNFVSWDDKGDVKDSGSKAADFAGATHNHDTAYAPISKGVTNGDTHDHNGGDGAQINYNNLSNLPTIPSYAEGTFTPVLTGDTTNPVYNGTLTGKYVKIGKLVRISIEGANVNITSAGAGLARITTGLPFLAQGTQGVDMPVQYAIVNRTDIHPLIINGESRITLHGGTGYGTTLWAVGTANLILSGSYMTA